MSRILCTYDHICGEIGNISACFSNILAMLIVSDVMVKINVILVLFALRNLWSNHINCKSIWLKIRLSNLSYNATAT